mgnify:FL=1
MILINLLPHRELARKRARQVFNISLVISAAIGAVIGGMIYLWYQGQVMIQEDRNQFLKTRNLELDREIKEVANLQNEIAILKARQQAVEELQSDRNLPVYMFNEVMQQLPEGTYLKTIKQEGRSVLFMGAAQSSERISEFLRNLSRNTEWINRPELIEIVAGELALGAKEKRRIYNFSIRAQLGAINTDTEKEKK